MSLFRASRRVTGPDGSYWELYASKTALPSWKEGSGGDVRDPSGSFGLLEIPFAVVGAIWSVLVFPFVRFAALLPMSVVRGRRSRAVRIEAVCPFPRREVLLWTTTDGLLDGVLDEIAAGLAAGKIVQPDGAVYSGRQTD